MSNFSGDPKIGWSSIKCGSTANAEANQAAKFGAIILE